MEVEGTKQVEGETKSTVTTEAGPRAKPGAGREAGGAREAEALLISWCIKRRMDCYVRRAR